jgi:hypothetical protein
VTPETAVAWLLEHRELAITLLTLLTGTAGSVRHYRRTGRLPLRTLPWRAYRRLFYTLRKRYFTVPRPTKEALQVNTSIDDVRTRLGEESFEPGWPLSYRYHGEDLNARRYFYDPSRDLPHRQLHIRGFELDSGNVELLAHEEPAPKHHPRAHLEESDMHDATPWLESAWRSPALDPRTFDSQGTDTN